MTEKAKRKPEETEAKACEQKGIVSATHMRSLLYSFTSRPGLANPPVSLKKDAWYKLIKNGWIMNVITSIAFLAAGYCLGVGGSNFVVIILLAAGAALGAGAILLLVFYLGTLIYMAATPP